MISPGADPEDLLALILPPPPREAIAAALASSRLLEEAADALAAVGTHGSSAALTATYQRLAVAAAGGCALAGTLGASTTAVAAFAEVVEAESAWARWACTALTDPVEAARAVWSAAARIDAAASSACASLVAAASALPTGHARGRHRESAAPPRLPGARVALTSLWDDLTRTATGWAAAVAAAGSRAVREVLADQAALLGRDLLGLGVAVLLADAAASPRTRAVLLVAAADLLGGGDNSTAAGAAENAARRYLAAGLGMLAMSQALQPTPRVHPYGSAPGVAHTAPMRRAAQAAAADPPATLAEAIATMDAVDHAGGEGDDVTTAVAVERLDFVDGDGAVLETRWIVTLPSTQEGVGSLLAPSLADAGTLGDWESDAASWWNSATGSSLTTAYERAALDAMEMAGIGQDEPVMLAGFSQGGMIAADIARSDAHDFTIAAVLGVGSPIDDPGIADGVAVVQLAHTDDSLVPQADGVYRAPDSALHLSIVAGSGGHDAGAYVATAGALDGPDATRAADLLSGFVGVEATAVAGAVAVRSSGEVYEFRE